jgi:hypothetical protein
MRRRKPIEAIPVEFSSYEEAADFWDTHDTTDYPRDFRTVKAVSELRTRHYEIEVEADVLRALRARARRSGLTLAHLANHLLRERLQSPR